MKEDPTVFHIDDSSIALHNLSLIQQSQDKNKFSIPFSPIRTRLVLPVDLWWSVIIAEDAWDLNPMSVIC